MLPVLAQGRESDGSSYEPHWQRNDPYTVCMCVYTYYACVGIGMIVCVYVFVQVSVSVKPNRGLTEGLRAKEC